jgi:hypothetical protein
VNSGEPVRLYVSTALPDYDLEVYRMGWYGGTGGRLITAARTLPGQNQPVPPPDPLTGLISAGWDLSYTVQTGEDWVTGVYLVKLIGSDGSVGYALFALRNDGIRADLFHQVALTTYQAYNNWGGKSLYDFNSGGGKATKVSFDRPYQFSGQGLFFDADFPMIRFLESRGYNLTYGTSLDLHASPEVLDSRSVFVSSFHDEYWSAQMREHLLNAHDAGMHLAFFDSNNVYWQVRFEPSADGRPDRVMVCYKDTSDPIATTDPGLTTVRWRDTPVSRPENALLGVMYEADFTWGLGFPWIVANADHWIYHGTGLRSGDVIPDLVGYEYDRVFDYGATPEQITLLADSPIKLPDGRSGTHNAVLRTAPHGALTFSAGTNYWPWALDDSDFKTLPSDPRVQLMTNNLLQTMIAGTPPADPRAQEAVQTPASAAPSPYKAMVLAEHPVGYWRLGEQAGLFAADEVSAHHGLYSGEPLLQAAGALDDDDDTAADFNGEDQHVTVPATPELSPQAGPQGQLTLEAWVRLHRLPTREPGTVAGKGSLGNYEYALRIHPEGSVELILWSLDGTTYQAAESDPGSVAAGDWFHLAGTYEHGVQCRVYVNGAGLGAPTMDWGDDLPQQGSAPFTIGRRSDGVQALEAIIDEVALYSTALGADSMQRHHALGRIR